MKRLITLIFLYFLTLSVHSQDYVFVLVDVSKSVSQNQLTNAKQTLKEVLTGSKLSFAFVSHGSINDLSSFKLRKGDKLDISKFGNLQSTLNINPNPTEINNVKTDVNQILSSTIWSPTDQKTYYTLAKAKIAEYAKNNNIIKYKLYIISDNINDDFGSGGSPNYPNDYTQNLAEGYNTANNPVTEKGFTKIKFNKKANFTLAFSPDVDISKYSTPNTGSSKPGTDNPVSSIILTSFANGKTSKPKLTSSNSFTLSWTCNCPPDAKFNVRISEIGGAKYKDQKKNLTTNSMKFSDLPSGKFRVVVSSNSANSAITFIETPSSNLGLLLFLLFVAAAIIIGYYFWNKKRKEKIDVFASNKSDDIFSEDSNDGSSSNNEYF